MEEYGSIQQLKKKEPGAVGELPIYPTTMAQAVYDAKTGASLEAILAQYNNIYVQYQGSAKDTRNIIPERMRRAGMMITYMNMDGETITERAASAVQKDNDHWGLDVNWTRIDELSLAGDISVTAQGTWVINGEDTKVAARGPKGDNGLTPWLKTINNRLHYSYDNVTWEVCSEPIAAYFRWSGNKIQISRDNKTWSDLSGEFADNLRIKGYVATKSALPSSASQGDIYGVGPTYAEEDTARTNPIYRFYVRNANAWVDNGSFTSIAAGIVQETGEGENVVMSQKAVSAKLAELGSKVFNIGKTDFPYKGRYYEKVSVGDFINTLEPSGKSDSFNSVALFIQKGGSFSCNEKKFPTDFPYAQVINAESLTVSELLGGDEKIYFVATSDSIVCLSTNKEDIEIVINTPKKVEMVSPDIVLLKKEVNDLSSYIGDVSIKLESQTIIDDSEDTVSDLWKKGNTFTLEIELQNFTQIYGLYGKDLSDGFDELGATNNIENGITLSRDYYAIRCYNTKGITKKYKVFGNPNLSRLSSEFNEYKIKSDESFNKIDLHTNYKVIVESNQDAVSEFWKKGSIFTLEADIDTITQIYGLYGKTTEEGFDLLGSNVEAAKGITLQRDYYAIRCYNTAGIEKVYKVFRTPNLSQIHERISCIKSPNFYYKNQYTHVSGINKGDYVPNFDGRIFEYNGTYSIHLPLSDGSYIKIKNNVVLGDFNKLIVLNTKTRICTEAISIANKTDIEYTATEDCIVIYSTYSAETIIDIDICNVVLNNLVSNVSANKNYRAFFDYKVALSMDRTELKTSVEIASCGKCTVIYDNNGYPSLMYKIPITSIASLNDMLGDDSTPHPAFVVNGETKKCIYAAVFMNSEYNGVPVSWFGLPTNGHGSHTTVKEKCKSKGEGWHMETIWERSLISLLSAKYHNNTPRGNNDKGRSFTHKHEYVELVNNGLPGSVDHGRAWINGTQPKEWSHNNSEWGIYDIIGGYHERCDLLKIDNGKIIMSLDNSFNSDESAWFDTGVYLTWQNNKITIDTNIKERVGFKQIDVWTDMDISQSYDGIDLDLRKKMVLALITPYLSSRKDKAVDFNGSTWINDSIIAYPFLGGAAAYVGSSLGMNIMSYSSSEDHGNIGARLFYIE